jgi:hypothetical protein
VFRLRVVLTCLLYRLLCCLVGVLARGGGERELEIVLLRHQLAILRRGGRRPRYTTVDRALLASVSRLLPPERWSCFAVSPQTLRRLHRALLEGGRRGRRRRPGRPPLAAETRGLIRRLARENPRWGYTRIEGELLKLGIGVSATTIATVLRSSGLGPAPRRIGPSWSEFLRAQAHSMLGGSPSSAGGDDAPADDASEPNGSPQLGRDRQIEAGDHLSAADAVEPRSASHLVWSHSAPPRPRVSPRPDGPLRLPPSHRSHARDGPQRAGPRSSHSQELKRDVKAIPPRPTFARADVAALKPPEEIRCAVRPPARAAPPNRYLAGPFTLEVERGVARGRVCEVRCAGERGSGGKRGCLATQLERQPPRRSADRKLAQIVGATRFGVASFRLVRVGERQARQPQRRSQSDAHPHLSTFSQRGSPCFSGTSAVIWLSVRPGRQKGVDNQARPSSWIDAPPVRFDIVSQRFDERDVEERIPNRRASITGDDPNFVFALDDELLARWRVALPCASALIHAPFLDARLLVDHRSAVTASRENLRFAPLSRDACGRLTMPRLVPRI